jgi:spermidine synthase
MSHYYRPLLLSTVFLTGAAVLIFEVTAVRALSPFFGTSIYVVSSVLTIILAALSFGYYVGGRLADRLPDVRALYLIIGFAGLLMNLLYLLSIFLFPIASQLFPVTYGPLVLSFFFFLAPAFLLGIDSPFVIKLLTKSGDDTHNGATVGSVFFWSTVGSIVGSLASGFLLIPFIGVKLTFVLTATTLSIFSSLAYLYTLPHTKNLRPRVPTTWTFSILIVSVLLAATILKTDFANPNRDTLLYRTDGYYSQIEVREQRPSPTKTMRTLHREVNHSSAIELGTTTFAFQYPEYARAYRHLQTETDNFLMIGGGAYTIPRTLLAEDPNLKIDVVEIEPSLYTLAQTYFELATSSRLRNFSTDARAFLNSTHEQYDVIYIDVFQSGLFIPQHLSTVEFFSDVHDQLTAKGVVIINMIGIPGIPEKSLTGSLIKTIQAVFPELQPYTASNHTQGLQNITLIARKDNQPIDFPDSFMIDRKNGTTTAANHRELPLQNFHLAKQMIFTDDLAPVELLVAKQILLY